MIYLLGLRDPFTGGAHAGWGNWWIKRAVLAILLIIAKQLLLLAINNLLKQYNCRLLGTTAALNCVLKAKWNIFKLL